MTAAVVGARAATAGASSGAGTGATAARATSGAGAGSTAGGTAGGSTASKSTANKKAAAGAGAGFGLSQYGIKGSKRGMSRVLVAEFLICMIILGLSPLSAPETDSKPANFMKSGTAMAGVFVVLGLISAIGPKSSRAAAAFGALVTLALVVDQRSIFGVMVDKFGTKKATLTEKDPEGLPPIFDNRPDVDITGPPPAGPIFDNRPNPGIIRRSGA